jgi:type I restriction enzyme M protein
MTNEELKALKDRLWNTADLLRQGSHLSAQEYSTPVLGLIFLRYADSRYAQYEEQIQTEFLNEQNSRASRSISDIAREKCGFYIPDEARFSKICETPGSNKEKAIACKTAMEAIEKFNPELRDVLPKNEFLDLVPQGEEANHLLENILRNFRDIPDGSDSAFDIFGEIYEYFIGQFAMEEGKGGGAFYTPSTVVRFMVEVLAPEGGSQKKFLDPACGSGGMFVQTARYMHRHNSLGAGMEFRAYGVEKDHSTVKLSKMNLLLNNIRGEVREANTFYSDPYSSFGAFDYVMANPPFNVDEVPLDAVKNQARFNFYGLPKRKSGDETNASIPNANYLWISQFITALNESGRGAFVMANTACDSGGTEYDIRKAVVLSGVIKQMVTLPSNMFNTVTLPATLWFIDKKAAENHPREILFIDAKNNFTVVDKAHRKFSDEQIMNLSLIGQLYDGKLEKYDELLSYYESRKKEGNSAYWEEQIRWVKDNFPDGKYRDVIGLCKAASFDGPDGVIEQNFSLNPGRYVGVADDVVPMSHAEFVSELQSLNSEYKELTEKTKIIDDVVDGFVSKLK